MVFWSSDWLDNAQHTCSPPVHVCDQQWVPYTLICNSASAFDNFDGALVLLLTLNSAEIFLWNCNRYDELSEWLIL